MSEVRESSSSDVYVEIKCQPCATDGKREEANGYCRDCKHYLCKKCYDCHRVPMPCWKHELVDADEMPRPSELLKSLNELPKDRCSLHKNEPIKFLCQLHNSLICGVCITINHASCPHKIYIHDMYEDSINKLTEFSERCKEINDKAELNQEGSYSDIEKACKEITQFRKEINEFLDNIESELMLEVETTRNNLSKNTSCIKTECDDLILSFQTQIDKLDALKTLNQNSEIFRTVQSSQEKIKKYEERLTLLEHENKLQRYKFECNQQLNALLQCVNKIGNIRMVVEYRHCKISNISDINVKSSRFSKPCWISGTAILTDRTLAIVDSSKQWVKLVNTSDKSILCQLKLNSPPWDITGISDTKVAVTMPEEKKIQCISICKTPTFSLVKDDEIKVNGKCWGIAYTQGRLAITLTEPIKVQLIDMLGAVLINISTDHSGRTLFREPNKIIIASDNKTMYVTDSKTHALVCVTLDGAVKAIYNGLRCPTAIAVTEDGTVLVCGLNSTAIQQLTPDCNKLKDVLVEDDGFSSPVAMAYCDKQKKLYVGMKDVNVVKVIQLKF